MPDLPERLPETVLALRQSLPLKPAPVTLTGRFVQLRPMDPVADCEPLFAVSNGDAATAGSLHTPAYDADALIWRYMFDGPFATFDDFHSYLQRQVDVRNALCFCALERASGAPVGIANVMNNSPADLKIELGGIWYSPLVQRTPVNTEATYLMLMHCFGLGYRRVEWKCHSHNERSRRAALRMGFTFEGIQEQHMIVKERNRDTAWFRILASEWPAVRRHLESLLYGAS